VSVDDGAGLAARGSDEPIDAPGSALIDLEPWPVR
jgi:hypothetical protein